MVAPKSPGHYRVREPYVEGRASPALFAVHQDATGSAKGPGTLSYAKGIGVTRAGCPRDDVLAEETETDLFGEQAVPVRRRQRAGPAAA